MSASEEKPAVAALHVIISTKTSSEELKQLEEITAIHEQLSTLKAYKLWTQFHLKTHDDVVHFRKLLRNWVEMTSAHTDSIYLPQGEEKSQKT
jgi:hypothetical protein